MKQFKIPYKDDDGLLENLAKIKQWRESHAAYTTIFRIYSDDMEREHIKHICECLDREMPDALYLGCTTNANIMDGVLTDTHIILLCTVFERETTKAKILQMTWRMMWLSLKSAARKIRGSMPWRCTRPLWICQ